MALPRLISDHCPIKLSSSSVDWGPKPFRFENCWLVNKQFLGLACSWWSQVEVSGYAGFKIGKKLHILKNQIKRWNKEVFGHIEEPREALSKVVEN